jgi:hypothetical protein
MHDSYFSTFMTIFDTTEPLLLRVGSYRTKESTSLRNTRIYRDTQIRARREIWVHDTSVRSRAPYASFIRPLSWKQDETFTALRNLQCHMVSLSHVLDPKSRGKFTLWQHDSSPILISQVQEAVNAHWFLHIWPIPCKILTHTHVESHWTITITNEKNSIVHTYYNAV